MKAVIVQEGGKLAIVEKKLRPLRYGEAKLKMEFCGVCCCDYQFIKKGQILNPGVTLGHEAIGIVTEIGEGVTTLKVGDRASISLRINLCGHCDRCTSGNEAYCAERISSGFHVDGGMAEESIVTADYSVKVPDGLDPAEASSVACAGLATYKALKVANVKPGEWVAIFGVGGLGNLGLQYAKNVFNAKVIAIDINDGQLNFAKEMGADITINSKKENPSEVIQKKVGGAHVTIITASDKEAFDSAFKATREMGTMVPLAFPEGDMNINMARMVFSGITIKGSLLGTRNDLVEAYEWARQGKVKPKVTLRKMEEINEIFAEMEKGTYQGRMVIDLRK